jgi:hypothetical protein
MHHSSISHVVWFRHSEAILALPQQFITATKRQIGRPLSPSLSAGRTFVSIGLFIV